MTVHIYCHFMNKHTQYMQSTILACRPVVVACIVSWCISNTSRKWGTCTKEGVKYTYIVLYVVRISILNFVQGNFKVSLNKSENGNRVSVWCNYIGCYEFQSLLCMLGHMDTDGKQKGHMIPCTRWHSNETVLICTVADSYSYINAQTA